MYFKHGNRKRRVQNCLQCRHQFFKPPATSCSRRCGGDFRTGPANPNWRGGYAKSQFKYRGKQKTSREFIASFKNKPCTDCNQIFPPICMDFDHRDPSTKTATISKLLGPLQRDRILAEIAKCDLVCANCHRIRTESRYAARREAATAFFFPT